MAHKSLTLGFLLRSLLDDGKLSTFALMHDKANETGDTLVEELVKQVHAGGATAAAMVRAHNVMKLPNWHPGNGSHI